MPNRFAKRIKSGEIPSVESLKAEFKTLAKASHPDLRGPEGAEEFILVRNEYERALQDFERFRWGFRDTAAEASRREKTEAPGTHDTYVFLALSLLLKRGFPKRPRHERQKMRYDYALWKFCSAFTTASGKGATAKGKAACGSAEAFGTFETDFALLRSTDTRAAAMVNEMLDELIDYARTGIPEMRTSLILSLGVIRDDPRFSPGISPFLAILASLVGIGPALG